MSVQISYPWDSNKIIALPLKVEKIKGSSVVILAYVEHDSIWTGSKH